MTPEADPFGLDVRERLEAEIERRTVPGWSLCRVEVPPAVAEALEAEGLALPALLGDVRVEVARGDPGSTHYRYRCGSHGAENCIQCLRWHERKL